MNFTCERKAKALAPRMTLEGCTWPFGSPAQGPQRSNQCWRCSSSPGNRATQGHKASANKRAGLTKESLQLRLLVFPTA